MLRDYSRIPLGIILAGALLFMLGVLLYCYHIGNTDFVHQRPAQVAFYARQMNAHTDWLIPHVQGEPRFEVAPLYLWLVKIAAGLDQRVGPDPSRLPASICMLLMLVLVGWWFYIHATRYGRADEVETPAEGFALLAALMTATCPALFVVGRLGTPEAMMMLFYVAAAFCWGESFEARRSFYAGRPWRFWLFWGYALAGLGMLAGGPVVLFMLWVGYATAARSYRLGRPDPAHLAGFLLAVAISGWWPLAVLQAYPGSLDQLMQALAPFQFVRSGPSSAPFAGYLNLLVISALPWVALSAVMIGRVGRKLDRSPTLVFWAGSVVGNLLWLWLLGAGVTLFLPALLPLIFLLATTALHRWNFENLAAKLWRLALRLGLVLALALGVFLGALINSTLGIVMFVLIAMGWIVWIILSRIHQVQYTPWESTVRLAAMVVLVFLAAETMYLENWEPRRRFHEPYYGYFARLNRQLPEELKANVFLYAQQRNPLYDYYLPQPPELNTNLQAIENRADRQTFLAAGTHLDQLAARDRLISVTECPGSAPDQPREVTFRVIPNEDAATSPPIAPLALRNPLRLVLMGNTGTRSTEQQEVADRIEKLSEERFIPHALLMGNNLWGPSFWDHLEFIDAFERPYRELLKQGMMFHALLGHEDQSYAWLQAHYRPFHMYGQRYYSLRLGGGLLECFMLDSEGMHRSEQAAQRQIQWLDRQLATRRTPWTLVGLYRPLLSAAAHARVDEDLARRLLPLFKRHHVDVVAWAGGKWYERLKTEDHPSLFFNVGWGGDTESAQFLDDPRLRVGYDQRAGFVLFEVSAETLDFTALNDWGVVLDEGRLRAGTPVQPEAPSPPAPAEATATDASTSTTRTTPTPVPAGVDPGP